MGEGSGFVAFGVGLDDDERFRCLKGFSRLSMKPCTDTYGSSLEHDPDSSERDRKEPERRRGEDVDRSSEKEEDIVPDDEEDLAWDEETRRKRPQAGRVLLYMIRSQPSEGTKNGLCRISVFDSIPSAQHLKYISLFRSLWGMFLGTFLFLSPSFSPSALLFPLFLEKSLNISCRFLRQTSLKPQFSEEFPP